MSTYREMFGRFKRSENGKYTKSILYKKQLGMCPSCMKPFPITKLEIHHLVSVKHLEETNDLPKLTDISNLVLLCRSCNARQGCKQDFRFTD